MNLRIDRLKSAALVAAFSLSLNVVQAQRLSSNELDRLTESYFMH